jgi:hypothetical protein
MTLVAPSPKKADPAPSSSSLPRFILRKRAVSDETDDDLANHDLKLPTVTSAFLTGLFADVAQVQDEKQETPAEGAPSSSVSLNGSSNAAACRPVKKSRVSLHHSMSRCGRSFKNLAAVAAGKAPHPPAVLLGNAADSPTGVADLVADVNECPLIPRLSKHDSLHFQLRCVVGDDLLATEGGGPSSSDDAYWTVLEAGVLAFPNLPHAVSSSSCNTLTRNLSDLQTSLTETRDGAKEEAYGWFVAVDDIGGGSAIDPYRSAVDPYAKSASATPAGGGSTKTVPDLAFVAPTAPHAVNQDDEVEWAKAADMVDDVLGDFF